MIYELICCFFLYAFLGWCLEVVYAAVQKRRFVNRGLLNGMLCPVYGLSMGFLLVFFQGLKERPVFLFLACILVTGVFEWAAGMLLEKILGRKCWDYSGYRDHIGTYICLRFSAIWAVAATLIIEFFHPLAVSFVHAIPYLLGRILMILLLAALAVDILATWAALKKMKLENQQLREIAQGIKRVSRALDNAITRAVERRMGRAFPTGEEAREEQERKAREQEAKKRIFAYGCGFHKLVWLFFLGAFLGDITETIFCLLTTGQLMSRSSVVYGPFSIVWGAGIAGFTLLLHRYQEKKDSALFFLGTVLGGLYEYICSVFTELVFGTVFWDYSDIPFNLGGRINLLYCFFWGIAAVIWMKGLYPRVSAWIERIPMGAGKAISRVFVVFMAANIVISGMALGRYSKRAEGIGPANGLEELLDQRFDDRRMERIYPNVIVK